MSAPLVGHQPSSAGPLLSALPACPCAQTPPDRVLFASEEAQQALPRPLPSRPLLPRATRRVREEGTGDRGSAQRAPPPHTPASNGRSPPSTRCAVSLPSTSSPLAGCYSVSSVGHGQSAHSASGASSRSRSTAAPRSAPASPTWATSTTSCLSASGLCFAPGRRAPIRPEATTVSRGWPKHSTGAPSGVSWGCSTASSRATLTPA